MGIRESEVTLVLGPEAAKRDQRSQPYDALEQSDALRDDLGQLLVARDANDRDEVFVSCYRVGRNDSHDVRERPAEPSQMGRSGAYEDYGFDHVCSLGVAVARVGPCRSHVRTPRWNNEVVFTRV